VPVEPSLLDRHPAPRNARTNNAAKISKRPAQRPRNMTTSWDGERAYFAMFRISRKLVHWWPRLESVDIDNRAPAP
jgi:hypothetical protein